MDQPSHPKIVLNRGFTNSGYTWSPFVTKLEFRLRQSNVPYKAECGSFRSAPRGKVPYILYGPKEGAPEEALGDSTLIIKRLIDDGWMQDANGELDAKDQVLDMGVRAVMEDKVHFFHIRERWLDNFYTMREHVLGTIPWLMRVPIGHMIYRKNVSFLHAHGLLKFSAAEVEEFERDILDTISSQLVASRRAVDAHQTPEPCFFLLGRDEPSEADFTLFGFIVSTLICEAGPKGKAMIRQYEVLLDYAGRIHEKYFPDYEKWVV